MKNILIYYLAIIVPFALLVFFVKTDQISSGWFCLFLFSYAFPYRAITDLSRLASKGVILKPFWKILIPGIRIRYFKELYLPSRKPRIEKD